MAGYNGWLGQPAQRVLAPSIDFVRSLLNTHGAELDRTWKALGGIVSIASGCWFILRSWNYAESRMPYHLSQYLKRRDARLLAVKDGLLTVIEGRTPSTPSNMALAYVGPISDALKVMDFGDIHKAPDRIDRAIGQLKSQKELSKAQNELFEKQLSAAYLLRGVILSAQASGDGDPEDRRQKAYDAEAFFDLAHTSTPEDPQVLVYRASNALYLGNPTRALKDYELSIELMERGRTAGDLYARACFGAAQLRFDENYRGKAVSLMEAALGALTKENSETQEAGEMHKFLGEAREEIGRLSPAIDATSAATRILRRHATPKSRALLGEAEQTLVRLRAAQS